MGTWKWIGDVQIGAGGQKIASGTGSPEGVVTAGVGSLYVRTDGGQGTTLYVKESGAGNTGWAGVGAGGGTGFVLNINGVPSSVTNVANLAAGSHFTLTDLGGGNIRLDVILPTPSTATITTASLSPKSGSIYNSSDTESGFVVMGKSFNLKKVIAATPARVRLYQTAAARDADLARPESVPPTPGTQHGVIADFYLDGTIAPLTWIVNPGVLGNNGDGSPSTTIYYNVTNADVTSRSVVITLTYVPLES